MSLLSRPGDKPSPREEAAVERPKTALAKRRDDIMFSLRNSANRSLFYKFYGPGKERDLEIERTVQNRLLDELASL